MAPLPIARLRSAPYMVIIASAWILSPKHSNSVFGRIVCIVTIWRTTRVSARLTPPVLYDFDFELRLFLRAGLFLCAFPIHHRYVSELFLAHGTHRRVLPAVRAARLDIIQALRAV